MGVALETLLRSQVHQMLKFVAWQFMALVPPCVVFCRFHWCGWDREVHYYDLKASRKNILAFILLYSWYCLNTLWDISSSP